MTSKGRINIYLLAFTVYFTVTTLGVPLYKHYCEGDLKMIRLFFQPSDCHSDNSHHDEISHCCSGSSCKSESEDQGNCISEDSDCCTNLLVYYKVDVLSTKNENKQEKSLSAEIKPILDYIVNTTDNIAWIFPGENQSNLKIPLKTTESVKLYTLHQQFIC